MRRGLLSQEGHRPFPGGEILCILEIRLRLSVFCRCFCFAETLKRLFYLHSLLLFHLSPARPLTFLPCAAPAPAADAPPGAALVPAPLPLPLPLGRGGAASSSSELASALPESSLTALDTTRFLG